ncbi:MAG: hypothetical protein WCG01_03850 [bacterium]
MKHQFEILKSILEQGGMPEFCPTQIIKEISLLCDEYLEAQDYLCKILLENDLKLRLIAFNYLQGLTTITHETLEALINFKATLEPELEA